ncbi:MAG: hypothetical protein ACR2LR_15575 [Hassallia sp.]
MVWIERCRLRNNQLSQRHKPSGYGFLCADNSSPRIKEEAELQGMDINEHGEEGYNEEFGERISITNR